MREIWQTHQVVLNPRREKKTLTAGNSNLFWKFCHWFFSPCFPPTTLSVSGHWYFMLAVTCSVSTEERCVSITWQASPLAICQRPHKSSEEFLLRRLNKRVGSPKVSSKIAYSSFFHTYPWCTGLEVLDRTSDYCQTQSAFILFSIKSVLFNFTTLFPLAVLYQLIN